MINIIVFDKTAEPLKVYIFQDYAKIWKKISFCQEPAPGRIHVLNLQKLLFYKNQPTDWFEL